MTDSNTAYGFGLEQARDISKATGIVLGTVGGGRAGVRETATAARSIVVELITELPADDYKPHAARQVNWNGSEWAFVQPVDVRKITAAAIAAGSADDPTRLFANPVGNLGLVVSQPPAGETTTTTTDAPGATVTTGCCGCYEETDYQTYSGQPYLRSVSGVSLECCSLVTNPILERQELDAGDWVASDVACINVGDVDHGLTDWRLTPDGVLTITHQTDGLLARYTVAPDALDSLCAQRFLLDESTTPRHGRDCVVCAPEVCVVPANGEPQTLFGCPACVNLEHSGAYELRYSGANGPAAEFFNGTTLVASQGLPGAGCRKDPLNHYDVVWDHNTGQFATPINIFTGPFHAALYLGKVNDAMQIVDFSELSVVFKYSYENGYARHFFTNTAYAVGQYPCVETDNPLQLGYSHSVISDPDGFGPPATTFGGAVTIVPVFLGGG